MLRSASAYTLPPRPPSPPSGPPFSMYFSRRKLAAPLPPLPAKTSILDSSMNFMLCVYPIKLRQIKKPYLAIGLIRFELRGLRGDDRNSSTLLCALDSEHHLAGDLGKQRVILADADVFAGVEFSTALAHDNAARTDQFAAVALYPKSF